MPVTIQKDTLRFLEELEENNDREWFNTNKSRYIAANENFIQFIQSLIDQVALFDKYIQGLDAKSAVFRIYRDTRFAKDKSPYKTNFGAWLMGKGSNCGVAGYYLHLQPGQSFLAGGVHMPEPVSLKAIRKEISSNGEELLKIINNRNFKDNFEITGDKLAKVPQGFEKDDPMAEYLKHKDLMAHRSLDDATVLSDGFGNYCAELIKAMVPFNYFVNAPFR